MCKKNGESVNHLILHCEVAFAIWNVLFNQFKLFWVMPRRVVDLFVCWWTVDNTWSVALWKMMLSCILWCLWRERNDRRFEDRERILEELKSLFFITLYFWIAAYFSFSA
jgi:hypothetical protein